MKKKDESYAQKVIIFIAINGDFNLPLINWYIPPPLNNTKEYLYLYLYIWYNFLQKLWTKFDY